MRTLSWLNIFEPILDRIIPKSVRKKENAKSQPDQWKSGMNKIEEEKIRKFKFMVQNMQYLRESMTIPLSLEPSMH